MERGAPGQFGPAVAKLVTVVNGHEREPALVALPVKEVTSTQIYATPGRAQVSYARACS